jgi:hypothetical protein
VPGLQHQRSLDAVHRLLGRLGAGLGHPRQVLETAVTLEHEERQAQRPSLADQVGPGPQLEELLDGLLRRQAMLLGAGQEQTRVRGHHDAQTRGGQRGRREHHYRRARALQQVRARQHFHRELGVHHHQVGSSPLL